MSPRQGLDRGALLSAAAQLADSDGFQALTLAALAQRLDVRSPSLYNHISGLPGLRQEMALMSVQQLSRALTAAIADRTGDDAIQAIAAAYIGFVRKHPGLYEASFHAPDREGATARRGQHSYAGVVAAQLAALPAHRSGSIARRSWFAQPLPWICLH